MDSPTVIKNGPLVTTLSGALSHPVRIQQVHPAFQKTNNRYTNQQRTFTPLPFNASAMSPMFYGYTDTPFSKL